MAATVATTGRITSMGREVSRLSVAAKNISFERNPLSSGTPAMAALATRASAPVTGIFRISPESLRMSRVPVS